jgi:hypothetical protein
LRQRDSLSVSRFAAAFSCTFLDVSSALPADCGRILWQQWV